MPSKGWKLVEIYWKDLAILTLFFTGVLERFPVWAQLTTGLIVFLALSIIGGEIARVSDAFRLDQNRRMELFVIGFCAVVSQFAGGGAEGYFELDIGSTLSPFRFLNGTGVFLSFLWASQWLFFLVYLIFLVLCCRPGTRPAS